MSPSPIVFLPEVLGLGGYLDIFLSVSVSLSLSHHSINFKVMTTVSKIKRENYSPKNVFLGKLMVCFLKLGK